MSSRIRRIETVRTAGELGALLLESRLIKERRPLFNVAARQSRRLIIACRRETEAGYIRIVLKPVERIDSRVADDIMGVFKYKVQAREYFGTIAKEHRLCPKLLGLERSGGACFSYHLHQCNGACVGEEDPAAYNQRLERAFEQRRMKAWPFEGAVMVEESTNDGDIHEKFLIDQWCLIAGSREPAGQLPWKHGEAYRFDYDGYKILYRYLTDEANRNRIRTITREELTSLRGNGSSFRL